MTITMVQGPAQGSAQLASGNFTVTLSQTPTQGNALILCYQGTGNNANPTITSISQTGVTWTKAVSIDEVPNGYQADEIWLGSVGSSAGTTITVTVGNGTGGGYNEVADVCEWTTGSAATWTVDKTASNGGNINSGPTTTGTTATISQAEELEIGAIGCTSNPATQTSATNGFTLLDGVAPAGINSCLAYLYKVVSTTGTANTGTSLSGVAYWSGCIATFKAESGGGSSLTASPPLSISDNQISIPQASTSTNGYLASSDWNTFNNKYGSGSSPTFGIVLANDYVTTNGYVTACGGTSAGPGYRFSTFGSETEGYYGGQTGIGLNRYGQIVLNAGYGGVVTAAVGNKKNTLDDGSGNMTISGSTTFTGSIIMPCASPYFTWAQLEPYLWGLQWVDNQWVWTPTSLTLPLAFPYIHFNDSTLQAVNQALDIGVIRTATRPDELTLWISRHLIVKKDFACGGVANIGQGALVLGSDWDANNANAQMPQIYLAHSEGSPYPDDPKRDTLQIWRAEHIGFGNAELNNLTSHGNIYWNTQADQEWVDIGSIQFRKIDGQQNFQKGMQLKGTVSYLGGDVLYPVIQIVYLDHDLSPDPWRTSQEFRPNGDTKIWGTLLYSGSLVHFDFMDDLATLRSIKSKTDSQGHTIHDPDTLKFLQDDDGFFDLNACIGWELSIQQKFLQEIDSMKTEIAGLKSELTELKGR
jgi:hypothetical protein